MGLVDVGEIVLNLRYPHCQYSTCFTLMAYIGASKKRISQNLVFISPFFKKMME